VLKQIVECYNDGRDSPSLTTSVLSSSGVFRLESAKLKIKTSELDTWVNFTSENKNHHDYTELGTLVNLIPPLKYSEISLHTAFPNRQTLHGIVVSLISKQTKIKIRCCIDIILGCCKTVGNLKTQDCRK
jgi:hypothetical protein